MTDAKTATTPDVPDELPSEVAGPNVAAALTAIAKRLDAGAGKRPNNRPAELFSFTPQVLRNVATMLRKYADVATMLDVQPFVPAATDPPVPEQRSADAPADFSSPLEVTDIDDDPEPSDGNELAIPDWRAPLEVTDIDDDPEEPGAPLEEAPKHTHAPVVLAPGEPAASGHYAPGTAGYVDPKASS